MRKIINSQENNSYMEIRDLLHFHLKPIFKEDRPVVFICIGTDRSTGDSLGPLVGEKLKFLIRNNVTIYGNLEEPVHAKNLTSVLDEINAVFANPYIVAIDASLGDMHNVGNIVVSDTPIHPGSALNKNLPAVGDLSISAIVNISGGLDFMVLQNTRLFTVMHLSEIISKGIYHSILKCVGKNKSQSSKLSNVISLDNF